MESLFYIGQKVVAIRNHSIGKFKKGQEFIVLDIMKDCCGYSIKIYNDTIKTRMYCPIHGKAKYTTIGAYYLQTSFAPVQEIGDMTYEDAIELVTESNKQLT